MKMNRIIIATGLVATAILLSTFLGNWFTAYGEELPCLKFNDGKIAIIERMMNGNIWTKCGGYDTTMGWFFQKGYEIKYENANTVIMTR